MSYEFRTELQIKGGQTAESTIYPRHPDEVVARVPKELQPLVREDLRKLRRGKCPVFFSRRFFPDNERADRIVKRVQRVLESHGCIAVEAYPEPIGLIPPFLQVSSKMWVSKAGIVLVAGTGKKIEEEFSLNLAHEFGFLQGQGKPVMLLVEGGLGRALEKFSNAYQIAGSHFASGESAFNPSNPKSIDQLVERWVELMKRMINWKRK